MPRKTRTLNSRIPRPSLTWRPIFMPRDEFDDLLRGHFVVDSATLEHASALAGQLVGGTVVDALEILMRIGVLLSEENIPNDNELDESQGLPGRPT